MLAWCPLTPPPPPFAALLLPPPPSPCVPPQATPALLSPADAYMYVAKDGQKKAEMSVAKTFTMALYAGAYIAFGGFLGLAVVSNCPGEERGGGTDVAQCTRTAGVWGVQVFTQSHRVYCCVHLAWATNAALPGMVCLPYTFTHYA